MNFVRHRHSWGICSVAAHVQVSLGQAEHGMQFRVYLNVYCR